MFTKKSCAETLGCGGIVAGARPLYQRGYAQWLLSTKELGSWKNKTSAEARNEMILYN